MQLTPEQVAQFAENGYLLLRGALTDADLDPIIAEYEEYIGRRAEELLAAGHISALYADESFDRRLVSVCREDDAIYKELDIMHLRGRASFEFLRNDRLLDLVESLVGPEITCSPIQHIRAKLPAGVTPSGSDSHVAPWHQDAGVTWEEADPHFILTVWLPLCAATPENGCLQILPRAHRNGLVQHHIKQGLGTVIIDEEMPQTEALTLPMDKGDVLLMNKQTPHRSTPNNADTVRWSMDLRYQETGTPTGRPFHPDFVARSRSNPVSELRDYDEWCRRWVESLAAVQEQGVKAHRWEVVQ
ncbi:MAG: phytanoyl-CoA dioxygenase family protein [Candidatus Latescibacteria bacterium]|nr:phytanoyl-CoA dioxygenase family protein [Candidatus Latescibacterota bacterium]